MSEMQPIESIHQFANLIAQWHGNKVSQLRAALNVPDDVQIEMPDPETGEPVAMNVENREGFKAGMVLALSLMSELPFAPVEEDAPSDSAEPEQETPDAG